MLKKDRVCLYRECRTDVYQLNGVICVGMLKSFGVTCSKKVHILLLLNFYLKAKVLLYRHNLVVLVVVSVFVVVFILLFLSISVLFSSLTVVLSSVLLSYQGKVSLFLSLTLFIILKLAIKSKDNKH